MILSRAILPTPIGDMLALDSGEGLCALEFTGPKGRLTRLDGRPSTLRQAQGRPEQGRGTTSSGRLEALERRLRRWFPPHEIADRETPMIIRTRAWLDTYFAGAGADIGGFVLDLRGAVFEQQVWTALRAILPGETTSYGAIAKAIGRPGASRAVGAANGANPIAIVIPCHRVIGSSGSLTGYGGGLDRKSWLLDHERRWRQAPEASLF